MDFLRRHTMQGLFDFISHELGALQSGDHFFVEQTEIAPITHIYIHRNSRRRIHEKAFEAWRPAGWGIVVSHVGHARLREMIASGVA